MTLIIALLIYFFFHGIITMFWGYFVEPPGWGGHSLTYMKNLSILARTLVIINFVVSLWLGYKIASKFISKKKF